MALKISYTDENTGYTYTEAYVRIERMDCANRSDGVLPLSYGYVIYTTQTSREQFKNNIRNDMVRAEQNILDSNDFWGSLYAHLKTQPGFEDAVDC